MNKVLSFRRAIGVAVGSVFLSSCNQTLSLKGDKVVHAIPVPIGSVAAFAASPACIPKHEATNRASIAYLEAWVPKLKQKAHKIRNLEVSNNMDTVLNLARVNAIDINYFNCGASGRLAAKAANAVIFQRNDINNARAAKLAEIMANARLDLSVLVLAKNRLIAALKAHRPDPEILKRQFDAAAIKVNSYRLYDYRNNPRNHITQTKLFWESVRMEVTEGENAFSQMRLVIADFLDSVTIITGDSVANVEVRHMSVNAGICEVKTGTTDGTLISTSARLAHWSDWHVLTSSTISRGVNVTTHIQGDCSVRSQVKYYR